MQWIRRHRSLALIVGLLICTELGLWVAGYTPGVVDPSIRVPPPGVVLEDSFTLDSLGILRVNPKHATRLRNLVAQAPRQWDSLCRLPAHHLANTWQMARQRPDLFVFPENWGFDVTLRNLALDALAAQLDGREMPPNLWDSLRQRLTQIRNRPRNPYPPILPNAWGYRSVDFQPESQDTGRPRVLLIGDSFTWGLTAQPIQTCFADLLAQQGYCVYNLGIPGTDPAQYEAQVRHWLPRLKPDVVVVNYYIGNDWMWAARTVQPDGYFMYPTFDGWLNGAPRGDYLGSLERARQYAASWHRIPVENGWLERLCATTALTTRFWRILANNGYRLPVSQTFSDYWHQTQPRLHPVNAAGAYLERIQALAGLHQIPCIISLIPEKHVLDEKRARQRARLPGNLRTEYPNGLRTEHYAASPDEHFNTQGHAHYARHLRQLLDSTPSIRNRPQTAR